MPRVPLTASSPGFAILARARSPGFAILARARGPGFAILARARIAGVLASIRDYFPLTPSGVLLATVGALIYFVFAEKEADFVLLGFGITAMALVALSLLAVLVNLGVLLVSLRKKPVGLPESLTVGVETETTFRCSRFRLLAVSEVSFDWVVPAAIAVRLVRDGAYFRELVTPLERGRFTSIVRRFSIHDVFGFATLRFRRRWETTLRIQPVPGRADVTLAIRRATDDGYSHPSGQPLGELVEMRRYAAGDPMRHILWKVFARSRKLMVREPERAIAPKPAMVGFFVAGANDEPSASTARLFLEEGLLGADFVFAAEGSTRPTSNVGEAIEQVIESHAFRASGADSLGPLLRSVDRGRLDNLVVFAPSTDGAWVDKVLAAAKRLPLPPTVVMTVDGQLDRRPARGLGRFFFRRSRSLDPIADVPQVYDRLRSAGVELRVLHRQTGAAIDQHGIEAWRSLR